MQGKNELFIALALAFLLAGCIQILEGEDQRENGALEQNLGERTVFSLKLFDSKGSLLLDKNQEVEKGINAFEAMQQAAEVEYEDYGSLGAFVKSIEGIKPGQGNYFALYINGVYANKGISSYSIKEETLIEWKIEKLEDFGLK